QGMDNKYYLASVNQNLSLALGMAFAVSDRAAIKLFDPDIQVTDQGNGMSEIRYTVSRRVAIIDHLVRPHEQVYEPLDTLTVTVPTENATNFKNYIKSVIEQVEGQNALK